MAGGYKGDLTLFPKGFQTVEQTKAAMDGQLKKLRSEIEATRAGWQGEAATAFNNVMHRFDEDGMKLNGSLQEIGELINTVGQKYGAQDEGVVDQINQVGGQAGQMGGGLGI